MKKDLLKLLHKLKDQLQLLDYMDHPQERGQQEKRRQPQERGQQKKRRQPQERGQQEKWRQERGAEKGEGTAKGEGGAKGAGA